MDVRGKRIVVTGATGGLGPSVVEALLSLGAEVIAVARRRTGLDALRATFAHHERLHVAECDVTDPEGIEALLEAVEGGGPLFGVVHASGAFTMGPLADLPAREVIRLVRGNLEASALVIGASLRRLLPRKEGSIVVIAADRALAPAPSFSLYGAAKAGVVHLVQATALEASSHGVRVNAILPGIIDTPDNRAAMPDADPSTWVRPEAIAKSVVFLLSSHAEGVNGALLTMPIA